MGIHPEDPVFALAYALRALAFGTEAPRAL